MTSSCAGEVMAAMIFISLPQEEHREGSSKNTLAIDFAQLRRRFFESSLSSSWGVFGLAGGGRMGRGMSSLSAPVPGGGEGSGLKASAGGSLTGGASTHPTRFRNVVDTAP